MCNHTIRIVLADGDEISRKQVDQILTTCGYQIVAQVSDGFDAVECCRELHPDLILLDIDLPLLDGLSAARYIRKEELADTVMIVTGCSDWNLIEQAKEFGVSGYLRKPVDAKALIPSIELAVARSREIQSLRSSIAQVSDQLESRTVIDRAKGLLMSEKGFNDAEANDFLRQVSESKKLSVRQVAEILLVKIEN